MDDLLPDGATTMSLRVCPQHPCNHAGEDAERFIEEARSDDPELASDLRIEERELDAGGLN